MGEKYNIGETAGILGISTELLRHYERKGIITPKRDENGYRGYDLDMVKRLTGVRRSRAFGFSLEDADRLLMSSSREETLVLYHKRLGELEEELRRQERIRDALRTLISEMEHVVEDVGVCRLTVTEPILRYNFQHNQVFAPISPEHLRWQEGMPVVCISPSFHMEDIRAGSDDCDFGYAVPLDKGRDMGLDDMAGAAVLPGGRAVTTVITSRGTEHIRAAQMRAVLDYAGERGLRATGDAWGVTVHNFGGVKYHRMFLPVAEN